MYGNWIFRTALVKCGTFWIHGMGYGSVFRTWKQIEIHKKHSEFVKLNAKCNRCVEIDTSCLERIEAVDVNHFGLARVNSDRHALTRLDMQSTKSMRGVPGSWNPL